MIERLSHRYTRQYTRTHNTISLSLSISFFLSFPQQTDSHTTFTHIQYTRFGSFAYIFFRTSFHLCFFCSCFSLSLFFLSMFCCYCSFLFRRDGGLDFFLLLFQWCVRHTNYANRKFRLSPFYFVWFSCQLHSPNVYALGIFSASLFAFRKMSSTEMEEGKKMRKCKGNLSFCQW